MQNTAIIFRIFNKIKESLPGIDIRIAKYKNDSGIIGAAMLEYVQ